MTINANRPWDYDQGHTPFRVMVDMLAEMATAYDRLHREHGDAGEIEDVEHAFRSLALGIAAMPPARGVDRVERARALHVALVAGIGEEEGDEIAAALLDAIQRDRVWWQTPANTPAAVAA